LFPGLELDEAKNRAAKLKADVAEVYRHYLEVMGISPAAYKLTRAREAKVRSRLAEFHVDDVRLAITNCSKSTFHMGANENKRRYNGLAEHILKSQECCENWAAGRK